MHLGRLWSLAPILARVESEKKKKKQSKQTNSLVYRTSDWRNRFGERKTTTTTWPLTDPANASRRTFTREPDRQLWPLPDSNHALQSTTFRLSNDRVTRFIIARVHMLHTAATVINDIVHGTTAMPSSACKNNIARAFLQFNTRLRPPRRV